MATICVYDATKRCVATDDGGVVWSVVDELPSDLPNGAVVSARALRIAPTELTIIEAVK